MRRPFAQGSIAGRFTTLALGGLAVLTICAANAHSQPDDPTRQTTAGTRSSAPAGIPLAPAGTADSCATRCRA
jgi:hypothetical protein